MSNRDFSKLAQIESADYSIELEFYLSTVHNPTHILTEYYNPNDLTRLIDSNYAHNEQICYFSEQSKPLTLSSLRYIYSQICLSLLDAISQVLADDRIRSLIDFLADVETEIDSFDREYEYSYYEV